MRALYDAEIRELMTKLALGNLEELKSVIDLLQANKNV